MAKENLTITTDIAVKAREVDFVTSFAKNWQALMDIIGIMRPVRKQNGTKLVSYEASVELQDGAVGEGEEIPYSKAAVKEVEHEDLTIEKYAKAVSIEAVNQWGVDNAIVRTDEAFLDELQAIVMNNFYAYLKKGTLTDTEDTFQMAMAMAIGLVKNKFKKLHRNASNIVLFVNINDVYKYLGAANITVQNQNGIDYLKNFMGANTVILGSDEEIPSGTVIGAPVDNIVLYYIDPADSDFQKLGLNYTVEGVTNLIGFHANGNYNTAVGESFAIMGMKLWAEYLDAISIVTFGSTDTAAEG